MSYSEDAYHQAQVAREEDKAAARWENYEQCECGQDDWDVQDPEDATCKGCGQGPLHWTVHRVTTHVARKDHHPDSSRQAYGDEVKAGDQYRLKYQRGYRRNGQTTTLTTRKLLVKGPGWEVTA